MRTVAASAILGTCAGVASRSTPWRVEHVAGPVAALCTLTPGPCQDVCGTLTGCSCTCWVDGLTDHIARTITLSAQPQAEAGEVAAHERCHARGGDEEACQ